MQLQLSMAVADALHEALLVRGEPLDAVEAACLLIASPTCPPALCRKVLDTLVHNDHRFCLTEGRVSLRQWETPDPDLADLAFVALDLETTGSRPGTSKITEIGAVRIEGFKEVVHFSTLVNPMRPIPPMITQITGISQDMVAGAPRIEEVIPGLVEFLKGAVVIAHNASFDVGFLNYELRRLKGRQLGDGAIDTLPLARALAPGLPNYKLGTVAEALGAPIPTCHRALDDAQAAGHIFVTLAERLREQGITRLSEVRSYAGPQIRGAVEKLALIREVPWTPGAYRFLDKDGRIVFVGRAARMRDEVKSYFIAKTIPSRKMRRAVRLVERIEWEETFTPLEAVVREHELILEHRPSCNIQGSRPENYTYLKVTPSRIGLRLSTTTRGPAGAVSGRRRSSTALLIGPFRGRSRLDSAVEFLQTLYPVRKCPARSEERPCVRGRTNRCLAPCSGDKTARARHDALVSAIMRWLAGDDPALPDLEERVDEIIHGLQRRRRHSDMEYVRASWEDLLSIRRSYASLSEALNLSFACLWPSGVGEGAGSAAGGLRMNVVWQGRLACSASLYRETLREDIEEALAPLTDGGRHSAEPARPTRPAVAPQRELDLLLAIRRWFIESSDEATIILSTDGAGPGPPATWQERVRAEALAILEQSH